MGRRRLPPRHARLIGAAIAALLAGASCTSDGDAAPATSARASPVTTAPCSAVTPGDARVALGDRWYLRHVPPTPASAGPVPLLVDLHGYSEGASLHASVTGWGAYGDDHGFVTVTPHALGDPPAWDLAAGGVDTAFVAAVVDDVEASLCIDADRVYVTGHSMGGFLISTLACTELADRIAAFAPVAGVRPVGCTARTPALVVHGTADETVLYDGGLSPLAAGLLDLPVDGPSVPAIVEGWRASGADVDLHTIRGGTHEWPAPALDLIWSYFEQHALDR